MNKLRQQYLILNSKNFVIVLISSNNCFLWYASRINVEIHNITFYGP